MIEGYACEYLPDGECSISDMIHNIRIGFVRSFKHAIDMAIAIINSEYYLTDEELSFLIGYVYNQTGSNYDGS